MQRSPAADIETHLNLGVLRLRPLALTNLVVLLAVYLGRLALLSADVLLLMRRGLLVLVWPITPTVDCKRFPSLATVLAFLLVLRPALNQSLGCGLVLFVLFWRFPLLWSVELDPELANCS